MVLQKRRVLNLSSLKFDDPKQITTRYLDIVTNRDESTQNKKSFCSLKLSRMRTDAMYHKWSYGINMDGKSEKKIIYLLMAYLCGPGIFLNC